MEIQVHSTGPLGPCNRAAWGIHPLSCSSSPAKPNQAGWLGCPRRIRKDATGCPKINCLRWKKV